MFNLEIIWQKRQLPAKLNGLTAKGLVQPFINEMVKLSCPLPFHRLIPPLNQLDLLRNLKGKSFRYKHDLNKDKAWSHFDKEDDEERMLIGGRMTVKVTVMMMKCWNNHAKIENKHSKQHQTDLNCHCWKQGMLILSVNRIGPTQHVTPGITCICKERWFSMLLVFSLSCPRYSTSRPFKHEAMSRGVISYGLALYFFLLTGWSLKQKPLPGP